MPNRTGSTDRCIPATSASRKPGRRLPVRLSAAALVGVFLVVPAAAQPLSGGQATATDLCQGQVATIVGTADQRHMRGTIGPDVIVTGGADSVKALEGDDVVCVTGSTRRLNTGDGHDHVRTSNGRTRTGVSLGRGDDTFSGGNRVDFVSPGRGTDHVATGGGNDGYLDGGFSLRFSDDVVALGPGNDRAVTPPNPAGTVDGGAGSNELVPKVDFDTEPGPWTFDNVTETGTNPDGTRFVWRNFQEFTFAPGFDGAAVTFAGSGRDERVSVDRFFEYGPSLRSVDMGAGDDRVTFDSTVGHADGGPGHDRLDVQDLGDPHDAGFVPAIGVDLRAGQLRTEGVRRNAVSFEDLLVSNFGVVELAGNGRENSMTVGHACSVHMTGRGGRDRLVARPGGVCDEYEADPDVPRRVVAFGSAGNDELVGRETSDVLVGGPGRDSADGRAGHDRCAAEVRRRCEQGGTG